VQIPERSEHRFDLLEITLRRAMNWSHSCDCEVCRERQRGDRFEAVAAWHSLLDVDEQLLWLEDHDADDEYGGAMRALLVEAAEAGWPPGYDPSTPDE
jgi:hypothetical protein